MIPILALMVSGVIFMLASFVFDRDLLTDFIAATAVDLRFDYFKSDSENIALSLFSAISALFFFALLFSLGNKPLILHSSYKKILFSFLVGAAIFILSPDYSNNLLAFTYMPLAIMATSYIEN